MAQHNPAEDVFRQRQQERVNFQQQLAGVQQPQRQQIPTGAAILAILGDTLSQGQGNSAGQLRQSFDRQFQLDREKNKLELQTIEAMHRSKLAGFDDFVRMAGEKRAQAGEGRAVAREGRAVAQEGRAAALAPSQLRTSEAVAGSTESQLRVDLATEDEDIKLKEIEVATKAEQLAVLKRSNAVDQATIQGRLKASKALAEEQIATSKFRTEQEVAKSNLLKLFPEGSPEFIRLAQGLDAAGLKTDTRTGDEIRTQQYVDQDGESSGYKKIYGPKISDWPEDLAQKTVKRTANFLDKEDGEIDIHAFEFRERDIQRGYLYPNIENTEASPEGNALAWYIKPEHEDLAYDQAVAELAGNIPGDNISLYQWQTLKGEDLVSDMSEFYIRKLRKDGVLSVVTAEKQLLDDVNTYRVDTLGLDAILTAKQAEINQLPLNRFGQPAAPGAFFGAVRTPPKKSKSKKPKVRVSPGAFGA